eukprot:7293272-Prymnesium_polylepis.1
MSSIFRQHAPQIAARTRALLLLRRVPGVFSVQGRALPTHARFGTRHAARGQYIHRVRAGQLNPSAKVNPSAKGCKSQSTKAAARVAAEAKYVQRQRQSGRGSRWERCECPRRVPKDRSLLESRRSHKLHSDLRLLPRQRAVFLLPRRIFLPQLRAPAAAAPHATGG